MSTVNASTPVALLFIGLWASACSPIPADSVPKGPAISEQEILFFLEPGVTTSQQVLDHLGQPNVILQDEQVVAYRWYYVHWRVAYSLPQYQPGIMGILDSPTRHVLLIQFDEADRIKKFERTRWPYFQSHDDFMRKWVGQK